MCGTGLAGNRNQNVYTAAVTENSVAFAGANSKLLDPNTPRSFVVTVRNLSDTARWYELTIPTQPAGGMRRSKSESCPAPRSPRRSCSSSRSRQRRAGVREIEQPKRQR